MCCLLADIGTPYESIAFTIALSVMDNSNNNSAKIKPRLRFI